jgi:hypothetical protein
VRSTGKARAVVFVRLFFARLFCVGVELGLSYSEGKQRLRLFENRAVGKTFGQKRKEVTGDTQDLYCS